MITIGARYRFIYPSGFLLFPEHQAHSHQIVRVIRRLSDDESDDEMYEVMAEDGWTGDVFAEELSNRDVQLFIRPVNERDGEGNGWFDCRVEEASEFTVETKDGQILDSFTTLQRAINYMTEAQKRGLP